MSQACPYAGIKHPAVNRSPHQSGFKLFAPRAGSPDYGSGLTEGCEIFSSYID